MCFLCAGTNKESKHKNDPRPSTSRYFCDHVGNLLEPHLPGRKGIEGGRAKDNRQFVNAVFWILRTGLGGIGSLIMGIEKIHTGICFCWWRHKKI